MNRGRTFSETDKFRIPTIEQTDDVAFDYWYPSWETWKFRRTLSYWVAIMFIEDSLLFVIGGAFSLTSLPGMNTGNMQALVITPYWVGSICFTFGAFAGVLEVVNVPNKDDNITDWCFTGGKQWRELRKYLGWEPLLGYMSYMIGATLFNVNTVLGYDPNLLNWEKSWLMWFPAALGSVLFTLGGFLECYHNRVWTF